MAVKEIEQTKTKEDIIEILDANDIAYRMTKCNGHEKICISFDGESNGCCNSAITILTCNKDICRVYPYDILYIVIEDRKSVLYLTDRKIEQTTTLTTGNVFSMTNVSPNHITAT